MITNGATVLMIVNLDSGTGKAVLDKAKAAGRGDDRLRPPDPQRRRRLLRQLRQRQGRHPAGRGPGQVPDRQEGRQADRRRAQRLADRQQRHAVQAGLRRRAQAQVRRRRRTSRARTSRCRTGTTPQAGTIFEQMLHPAAEDRRRAGRQRRPRQRRHRGAEEEQAQRQGPGHRPGRHRAGPAEHPRRRPVHDGLQGDQEGGRRGRRARHRAGQGREADSRPARSRTPSRNGRPGRAADPEAITKDNVKDVVADGFVTKDELCTGDLRRPAPRPASADPSVGRGRTADAAPRRSPRCDAGERRRIAVRRRHDDVAVRRSRPRGRDTPLWNCAGSTRASVPSRSCTTSTSPSTPARSPRWSATTAPASRRSSSASAGSTPIDAGEFIFDGNRHVHSPRDAAALGIEIVYQDLALCDNLDIVQNMFLGREPAAARARRADRWSRWPRETLASLSVRTVKSIRQHVASLSGGQRQTVAIAKAVLWNTKVVILDEPTAALGVAQTAQVLELVRRLADHGLAVVLISHNMNDVFEVSDRIAALYLGRMAAQVKTADVDPRPGRRTDHLRPSGDLGLATERRMTAETDRRAHEPQRRRRRHDPAGDAAPLRLARRARPRLRRAGPRRRHGRAARRPRPRRALHDLRRPCGRPS